MGASTTIPTSLDETRTIEVGGFRWTIRMIPAGILARLRSELATAHAPCDKAESDEAFREAVLRQGEAMALAYGHTLRWAVLRWERDGVSVTPPTVPETYDGRTFDVLAPVAVDRLMNHEFGQLAVNVANGALRENRLTADDLMGFR